jgi:predicted GIY-YIG superfamily endonuclease
MPRTRKHLSLVSEYLENISRDALENHQNVIRAYVQRRQGVYALYRKGKLYYVGLAKDLRGRLTAHVRDRHGESWDRFSVYLTIGDQHLKEMESLILRIVKLKGNKVKGKFAKSRDLRRQFARDIRSEHRKEDALLLGREWTDPGAKNEDESSSRPPALAAYFTAPKPLRATHEGKIFRAHVRRDGRIRFGGKVYDTPSAAGSAAVTGSASVKRACNGWSFWKYERAPGDWIKLNELRR